MATLAAWLASRGELPHGAQTTRPLGHVGALARRLGGMFGDFLSLAFLPLADATAFTFVVAADGRAARGDRARRGRCARSRAARSWRVSSAFWSMLSGHLGGGAQAASARGLGVDVALAGAAAPAVAMIQTRRLTQSESTGAIVFYFSSVTAVLSARAACVAAALAGWRRPRATRREPALRRARRRCAFAELAAIGLLGGCGQILMTHCYRFADASVIAAFDYVAMIWAAALGYLAVRRDSRPRAFWRARRSSSRRARRCSRGSGGRSGSSAVAEQPSI